MTTKDSERFSLPETHAAYVTWCEITGLDGSSSEWGEVWQVLRDTGLLDADRLPQQDLFSDPGTPLGDSVGARRLRMALIASAQVSIAGDPRMSDPATALAIVAALVDQLHGPIAGWSMQLGTWQLRADALRRVRSIAASPGAALTQVLAAATNDPQMVELATAYPALDAVLRLAALDDRFAESVFDTLDDECSIALAPLSFGGWLVFDSSPVQATTG